MKFEIVLALVVAAVAPVLSQTGGYTLANTVENELKIIAYLRKMSLAQRSVFMARIPQASREAFIARVKYLTEPKTSTSFIPRTDTGSNMVMSAANQIRTSGTSNAVSNSVGSSKSSAPNSSGPPGSPSARRAKIVEALLNMSRRYQNAARAAAMAGRVPAVSTTAKPPTAVTRPSSRTSTRRRRPQDMITQYERYNSRARSAVRAGCQYPMANLENPMISFMAFSNAGCRTGYAVCAMSGRSCVDVGSSIMCCPPGYNSGTLSMISQMNRMRRLMAQFS